MKPQGQLRAPLPETAVHIRKYVEDEHVVMKS